MEKQEHQHTKQQPTAKQAYEPPKAIFVPLKPEERLMGCDKSNSLCDKFTLTCFGGTVGSS